MRRSGGRCESVGRGTSRRQVSGPQRSARRGPMVASRTRSSSLVDRAPRAPRRLLRWLVVLALLCAGAPMAAAAISQTQMAREYAGREVAAALRRELGLIADIDEVDLDTARLSIVARGIALVHPQQGRIASAGLLRIRPSWWALLRGRVDLHAIT